MEYGLDKSVVLRIKKVLSAFPKIEEAIIYGSRALGTYRNGSDIDITLKADLSFDEMLTIEKKLDDLMLPYTIDLSIFKKLQNQDLMEHIDQFGKQFYAKGTVGIK